MHVFLNAYYYLYGLIYSLDRQQEYLYINCPITYHLNKVCNDDCISMLANNQTLSYIFIMDNNSSETTAQPPLPPPPPPFLLLNLPPPTIADYSYTLHYQKKHLAMINGQVEYTSLKEQVDSKLKKQYQASQLCSQQTESSGEKQLRNLQICSKCAKCGHWVQNTQLKTHASFHAAPVLDNLLLGDKHISQSRKELFQRNKVTHIVNAAAEINNFFEQQGVQYIKLELQDQPGEEVIAEATRAADFIDQSLKAGGTVFVHCALGKSRSVSAIVMYLMNYRNMSYDEALTLIRKERPIAKPNLSYEEQLREYGRKKAENI